MERRNSTQLAAALAAALVATLGALPSAQAELVYEDSQIPAQATRAEDRGILRQALESSERAQSTRQAQEAAPEAMPLDAAPAQPLMARATGDSAEDMKNMNKSELLRRARVREELRNEDSLQERLEELRLRDERRRTDQILGVAPKSEGAGDSAVGLPGQIYSVQEQVVAAPVTEHPGQAPARAAAPSAQDGVQLASMSSVSAVDQAAGGQSSMSASVDMDREKNKAQFSIMPRAGLGGMSNQAGYEINPHFAAGIGLAVSTNDYLSIELGYTYGEYGVGIASSNPFVNNIQMYQQAYGNSNNRETLTMKQNVFDAGLKIHLLGRDSTIRPFIGGGGAYAKNYINYNQQIMQYLNQNPGYYGTNSMGSDYQVSQYLGYLTAGTDVKMSKNISVGLMFRYYAVLSSSENSSLNNYGFLNPGYFNGATSPEKQYVGGTVAKANFYNILAGASFTF